MEAKYSVNITKFRKIIFLSQHYSAADCFLYVNGGKIYQFKVKDYKKIPISIVSGKYFKRLYLQSHEKRKVH